MDTLIQPRNKRLKTTLLWSGGALLIAALGFLAFSSKGNTYAIEMRKVSISEVVFDDFQDIIALQAIVEPKTTVLLDATEGGVVEELFAEEGAYLEKGQPILRLSNTALRLDFMNRETQIVEQINNLRSTRIALDQNKRQVQEQLVESEFSLSEAQRKFAIDSGLFAEKVIPENEFLASKANLVYLKKRNALLQERLKTDEAYRMSQLHNIDASVEMMERNLNAIRANLENLTVKAPISGQLNSFDHEIGQTKARGENLGRMDVVGAYTLSAFVDQYYLNRVAINQRATFRVGEQAYSAVVVKVLPTVVNNQFEIKLDFEDKLPDNLRRGQSLSLKLELSAKTKGLLLNRGAFYQSTNGKFVYVVNDKNEAEKRNVVFGAQNPSVIQIMSGLEAGEMVITSTYESFGNAERIILTP